MSISRIAADFPKFRKWPTTHFHTVYLTYEQAVDLVDDVSELGERWEGMKKFTSSDPLDCDLNPYERDNG